MEFAIKKIINVKQIWKLMTKLYKVLTLIFMLYLFKSENTFTSVIQRKKTKFCHKITVLILCVT